MTLFYLIRHGDIPFAPGDPELSPLGREQAAAVGVFLEGKRVARIYASPLRRAHETAEIIAEALGLQQVVVDPRLRERMNWGDVADQNWAEFDADWQRATLDPNYIPLGGLSAHQAAEQMTDFLRDMVRHFPEEVIAAVTHGGILGDFLTETFPAADLARLNPNWPLEKAAVITHCSITTLRWDAAGPHLESLALVVAK